MDYQVGRYKVVGKLGKGAMGMVFLADDPLLNRKVALKTIDLSVDDPSQQGFLRDRLLRDARAAAALSHPHIVGVYDVVEEGERAWLVMEYIPGETLAQKMALGPLEAIFAMRILSEVAVALDYTHARGVVHRDIKPSNIMIDPQGEAKVMDFGIARLAEGRTTTPTGMVMGTLEYMAPEQIKGEPVDGRADQFALAAVAYQVMTGSTLFGQQTLTALTYKLVNETPPPARVRNPNLPAAVDEVLSRALSKQPAERFVNCSGFVAALSAALSGATQVAAPTERTAVEPAGRSKWMWVGIAAAVLIVAGALAAFAILQRNRTNAGDAQSQQVPPVASVTAPAEAPRSSPPSPPPGSGPAPDPSSAPTQSKPAVPAPVKPTPPIRADAEPPVEAPPKDSKPAAPDPDDPVLAQAGALIEKREFESASVVLSKVIASHPRSAKAYELRALANQEQKLFERAIDDYSANLRLNPTHAYAMHQRAVCYVQLKQDDNALADLNRALELHPEFSASYVTRGFLYNRRRDFKRAIADFSQAIMLAPNSANAYLGRMIAWRESGQTANAAKDEKKYNELRRR